MGSEFFVHPQALNESSQVGAGTRIWAFAHVMKGAVVGEKCNIGDHAFIETGAVVGNGVIIKNGVGASAVDGICQGIGYTLVLIVMCVFREFFGAGTFGGGLLGGGALGSAPGVEIFPAEYGVSVLTLPVGGFLTLGALIALMQWAMAKSNAKKEKEAK